MLRCEIRFHAAGQKRVQCGKGSTRNMAKMPVLLVLYIVDDISLNNFVQCYVKDFGQDGYSRGVISFEHLLKEKFYLLKC